MNAAERLVEMGAGLVETGSLGFVGISPGFEQLHRMASALKRKDNPNNSTFLLCTLDLRSLPAFPPFFATRL